jgi:two-component system CheB/CheR fusion protein
VQSGLPRILIVDDFVPTGRTLEVLLRSKGYDCQRCVDGAAALRLLDTFDPLAVILDIGEPTMNGYELALAIRARANGGKYVLIALSGCGRDSDRRLANMAGMDAFYVKPAELNQMLAGIDYLSAAKDATGMPIGQS